MSGRGGVILPVDKYHVFFFQVEGKKGSAGGKGNHSLLDAKFNKPSRSVADACFLIFF